MKHLIDWNAAKYFYRNDLPPATLLPMIQHSIDFWFAMSDSITANKIEIEILGRTERDRMHLWPSLYRLRFAMPCFWFTASWAQVIHVPFGRQCACSHTPKPTHSHSEISLKSFINHIRKYISAYVPRLVRYTNTWPASPASMHMRTRCDECSRKKSLAKTKREDTATVTFFTFAVVVLQAQPQTL